MTRKTADGIQRVDFTEEWPLAESNGSAEKITAEGDTCHEENSNKGGNLMLFNSNFYMICKEGLLC